MSGSSLPTGIAGVTVRPVTGLNAIVTWQHAPNLAAYNVYYRVQGSGTWLFGAAVPAMVPATGSLTGIVTGLIYGATYEFMVTGA